MISRNNSYRIERNSRTKVNLRICTYCPCLTRPIISVFIPIDKIRRTITCIRPIGIIVFWYTRGRRCTIAYRFPGLLNWFNFYLLCNSFIRNLANTIGHIARDSYNSGAPLRDFYRSANLCRCGLLIYAHYGEVRRGKHIPAILGRRAVDILNSAIVFHDERDNLAAIPSFGYLYANLGFAGILIFCGRRSHIIGLYSAVNSLNTGYYTRMLGRSQRRKVGAGYANGVVIVAYGGVVGGNIYCSISLKPALNKLI